MIYVLFAVGLHLSCVFSFGEGIAGAAGELSLRSHYSGSFLTGSLATLVATPCTAPFMAAALGYAITQPWYRSFAIFEVVGFGMALPYLAIALSPGLRRFLPKPGAWMLRLKQFLAFPIRSEEHTSELQSPDHLVCRLLLEKKKRHNLSRVSHLG